MSLSNTAEQRYLDLTFLNIDFADIGDATGLRGSSTAGNFYITLHTADPGEGGSQSTNEVTYSGYARIAVLRSGSGFSRTGSTISNVANIQFAEAGVAVSQVATYFSIGTASSGAGVILGSGVLDTPRTITEGISPLFNAGTLQATFD